LPFFIEKCFNVLPCGQRILFVQIAIAIPSLSELEKLADLPVEAVLAVDADLPPRFNEAARKFFVTFLTHLAKRSAWVDIYQYRRKKR